MLLIPIVLFITKHLECFNKQKEAIKKTLDHVFGVVNQINPNYFYEIIPLEEANKKAILGNTVIKYQSINDPELTPGFINRKDIATAHITQKPLYSVFCINANLNKVNTSNALQSTYLHELLHAFGFDDTYETPEKYLSRYYGTSAMSDGDRDIYMHPNDIKILISLYSEKLSNNTFDQYIEKSNNFLNQYQEFYYNYVAEKCKSYTPDPQKVVNIDNLNNPIKTEFTRIRTYENGKTIQYTYRIEVYDGWYILDILDDKRNIIDSCQGQTYLCNGMVFLKDVELYKGLELIKDQNYSDGYINDFNLLKYKNDYRLYLDNNNDFLSSKQFYVEDEMEK